MFFLASGKYLSEIHVNGKSGPTHLISKLECVIQLGEFELVGTKISQNRDFTFVSKAEKASVYHQRTKLKSVKIAFANIKNKHTQ